MLPRALKNVELRERIVPFAAVYHEAVDLREQPWLPVAGKIALPPERERQIAVHMPKECVCHDRAAAPVNEKRNLLGADVFPAAIT